MAIAHARRAGYAADNGNYQSTKPCTVSGITTGNAIFVLIGGGDGNVPTLVDDNAGNTYAIDVGYFNNGTATIASCLNVISAPTTITAHFAAITAGQNVSVEEFSGFLAGAAFDKSATMVEEYYVNLSIGPTATTTQADELVIAVWGLHLTTGTWTKGANYTDFGAVHGTYQESLSEYRILTSTGAQTATGTIAYGAACGVLATYKMGTAPPATHIKTVDGVAYASLKTVDGVARASIKTVDGLA